MESKGRFIRRLISLTLTFALICSLLPCSSWAERSPWKCPECGREGNTGNFCGNCSHPAPQSSKEETITLTVFCGEPGDQPTSGNKIYKKIEKKLGIKFKFEMLSGNLEATLNKMISDKKYPDLIDGSYYADTLISKGVLINLLDYISPEKTPRLWAHIEPQKDRLIEKDAKGNDALYIIPNSGLFDGREIVTDYNGPAFFIQKQVLADAGYPDVKNLTLDGYFDLIEKFIAKHPENEKGEPYIGFAILCEDWRRFCLLNPVQHLMGRPNDGDVLVDVNDPEYHTETFIDKPYAKPYYKKLNEEFNKGLIKPETFVMSFDQYIAEIASGKVLGMFDQAWDFGTATVNLIEAGMDKNTYVALGPVYSKNDIKGIEMPTADWKIEEHYLNGSSPNVRRGFGISVKSKHAERIVAMWERLMSDEWQMILNWGIEGEDYSVKNNRLLMTAKQYANTQNSEWRRKNKADGLFNSSPKKQGLIRSGKLKGNNWEPGKQKEIARRQLSEYDKTFLTKYGYSLFTDFFNPPLELPLYGEAWAIDKAPVESSYEAFISIADEYLPQVIMCKQSEFDAKWDSYVEKIKPYAKIYGDFMQEQIQIMVN